MRLTQRQIHIILLVLMSIGAGAQFLLYVFRGEVNIQMIGFGLGSIVLGGSLALYLRGWEQARYLAVLAATVITGTFLDNRVAMEIFLPAIIALILAEPGWVFGAGGGVLLILAVRTGGQSIYLAPDNLITYSALVAGMVLSRLAVDTAQQLAEANKRAHAAQQEAEERALLLAERNDELKQLLAQNAEQQDVIHELSTPILPLTARTLMLPLVGALDSGRLLQMRQKALDAIHTGKARSLIIDVTGVPVIDTEVARGILETVQAVRLLGAEVTLVGIQSDVAQTIVGLGLDLRGLTIQRDLEAVLQRQQ